MRTIRKQRSLIRLLSTPGLVLIVLTGLGSGRIGSAYAGIPFIGSGNGSPIGTSQKCPGVVQTEVQIDPSEDAVRRANAPGIRNPTLDRHDESSPILRWVERTRLMVCFILITSRP